MICRNLNLRVCPAFLAGFVLLILSGSYSQAQYSTDREPIGPSSRKTGLVISELMPHPRLVPGFPTNSVEFIELYNSNPWDENIGGFMIDGVVQYEFPSNTVLKASAYLAVARQPAFLQSQYSITNVFGPWTNANTVEMPDNRGIVELRNRQGAVLLHVEYFNNPPWPTSADGAGHSMVMLRPSYGENDGRAWGQSDVVGGSPGKIDPVTVDLLGSIFINEWLAHTDKPLNDTIELYNHSNLAVDLSGAWLTDSPETNIYRIPNGTTIPPRGFLFFIDDTLGFNLFATGEKIFLVNSNQNRVIDAIDFGGQSNAVSSGRSPDGGPLHYNLSTRTLGTNNSAPLRYSIVINEIMFNPLSGDSNDEYLEIYNRGVAAVNLNDWVFVNGIDYTFPTNLFISAGAYFVIAKNPTNLMAIYPNLNTNNTFGPYGGTLANAGERITLTAADYDVVVISNQNVSVRVPVVISEVSYLDGGRWTKWGDGLGSSLELVDPEADTKLPSNWADSEDPGESAWTAIEYNGPLGEILGTNAGDSLILMSLGMGEFLVDEIEVRVNNGPNLVANGGFESGLAGWTLQGSHDFSTVENSGFAGSKSLHVRAGSRGDNQCNRIFSAPFAKPIGTNAGTVSIRCKARWVRGQPELLLRLHGGGAEAFGKLALPRKLGTPGVVNSRRIANAGPGIYDVKHTPIMPAASQAVVVTARGTDPQGTASFMLKYRLDPAPAYTSVAMLDNGTGGDAIANDGIYSATIPGQASNSIAAFYLEARDGASATNYFPQDVFPPPGLTRCWPNDAVARECVVRWGEVQMPGSFATYHLWITSGNSNRWHTRDPLNNTPMDGTFVYNNSRVIYNALPLYSGSPWHRTNSTSGPAGSNRVDYVINFPDDDKLLGASDFVLNNSGNPNLTVISDLSAVGEQTVYKIFEDIGLVNNHRRYFHFFVNGNQRSTTTQRAGNFIFEDSQQPNSDMVEQWFPDDPDGQLFKIEDWFEFETNGFDFVFYNDADLARRTVLRDGQPTFLPATYRFMFRKRAASGGESGNDFSKIYELIDAVSPADNPTNAVIDPLVFGEVADWENWMRHFAVERTVGNYDSYGWDRGKNAYLYKPVNGLFQFMPWDIDYSLGLGRGPTEPLFASNDPRVTAMFNTPAITRAYWRAFQDILNGPFNNAVLAPFIDARVAALTNSGVNIDLNAVADIKTYITDRRAFLLTQLATVSTTFAVEGASNFSTTNNLLVITGSAPVDVKDIWINGVAYPITWTSVTNFEIRVVLNPGANIVTLQGRDRLGNNVGGANTVLTVNYTGPAANPLGALVINEIMFAPALDGAQFVEIFNRSDFSFDLSNWRLDGADYIFPSGSIITNGQFLVLAKNRGAFLAAYGSVPVFGILDDGLSVSGQVLALVRPGAPETQIDAVRYEADLPWPANATDGYSLQLIDASQDNRRPSNWATDIATPFTPGASNSTMASLPAYDPIWLNEVQTENLLGPTDNFGEREPWIEIYNAGAVTLGLSNYFLANNYTTNLTQWQFPANATIAPGQFMLVWADGEPGETSGTNLHTNFRLDSGGKLALIRTNSPVQITDYLTWSPLGANISYGDSPDGQPVYRATLYDPTPRNMNTNRAVKVFINEWLASNTSGIQDPADTDRDDWFEIFNAGTETIDLTDYYLTDTNAIPTKFRVPGNGRYTIPPGGFLLVWADDETSQNSASRPDLHCNFKLPAGGGSIGLYAPDGVTRIDLISFGAQVSNISEGRYSDGSSARYLMTNNTPRTANIIAGANTPPTILDLSNWTVSPGQALNFTATATDPDVPAQTKSFALESGPPGASVTTGGAFQWVVPTGQEFGDYPVTVRVTDNGTPPRSSFGSFTIMVRPAPVIFETTSVAGQITFCFTTLPGHTYRILYKNSLSAPTWTQLYFDFVSDSEAVSVSDDMAAQQRFYQIVQLD